MIVPKIFLIYHLLLNWIKNSGERNCPRCIFHTKFFYILICKSFILGFRQWQNDLMVWILSTWTKRVLAYEKRNSNNNLILEPMETGSKRSRLSGIRYEVKDPFLSWFCSSVDKISRIMQVKIFIFILFVSFFKIFASNIF